MQGSSPGRAVAGRGGARGRTGCGSASSSRRRGTKRGRGCESRAGGRGRGRSRGRSGRRPRGASGGCCRRACRTRLAAACCTPSGSRRPCVCRIRVRPRLGRGRRRSVRVVARAGFADILGFVAADASGAAEQREEDGAVGMLAHGGGDLALELVDRSDDRFKRRDQREHRRAAGLAFERSGPALGRATELGQQFGRRLVAAVALARQERPEPLLAQPARVGRAWVALEERERDQVVQIAEQADRSRPEALELCAQLVGERHSALDGSSRARVIARNALV